jgi:hypothetical protein
MKGEIMLTRKCYKELVMAIKCLKRIGKTNNNRKIIINTIDDVVDEMCNVFERDNQRFDRQTFKSACELEE